MCEFCVHTRQINTPVTYAVLRREDPTRLSLLRTTFVRDITKRFDLLVTVIKKSIVDNDCFGLNIQANMDPAGRNQFSFPRTADKSQRFMEWLDTQVNTGILEVGTTRQLGTGIDAAWTNKYITDSYKRGVIRAREEMRKAGYSVEPLPPGGIQTVLGADVHLDRLGSLYSRAFDELKGITATMDTQISRVLTQGLADGDGPRLLARKLDAVIRGGGGELGITDSLGRYIPARRRAEMLARTEITRAHHQGTIQEYENFAVAGVEVEAEWATGGNPCLDCASLEGNVYTLQEIRGMIPLHPNCKCVALPKLKENKKEIIGVSQEAYQKAATGDDIYRYVGVSSSPEESTIKAYTNHGYFVNKRLRQNPSSVDLLYRDNLNNALDTLPNYKGTVHRLTSFSDQTVFESFNKKIKPDAEINFTGFTSTSKNSDVSKFGGPAGEGKILFHIESKTGKNISQWTIYPDEEEVLFKTSVRFRVISKTHVRDNIYRVFLEEI